VAVVSAMDRLTPVATLLPIFTAEFAVFTQSLKENSEISY
jgi:hypothetical protein